MEGVEGTCPGEETCPSGQVGVDDLLQLVSETDHTLIGTKQVIHALKIELT